MDNSECEKRKTNKDGQEISHTHFFSFQILRKKKMKNVKQIYIRFTVSSRWISMFEIWTVIHFQIK